MGARPTKAASNIYCRCRIAAAKYDDRLNSREGAAELLGVSASTLADYELGTTKCVPVDSVVRMADLYNAPELLNHYCTNECPIGRGKELPIEVSQLESVTLKLLSAFQGNENIRNVLIAISADGKITDDESADFARVLSYLEDVSAKVEEFKLWAEKQVTGRC